MKCLWILKKWVLGFILFNFLLLGYMKQSEHFWIILCLWIIYYQNKKLKILENYSEVGVTVLFIFLMHNLRGRLQYNKCLHILAKFMKTCFRFTLPYQECCVWISFFLTIILKWLAGGMSERSVSLVSIWLAMPLKMRVMLQKLILISESFLRRKR